MIAPFFQGADPAAVRERIGRILARDEFDQRGSTVARWLGERLEKAADWSRDLLGISPGSARFAVVLVLSTATLVVLWVLVRIVARSLRGPGGELAAAGDSPAAVREASVAALRSDARASARRGDRLAALRLYFRALVLGLSERGELKYRDAWTNRELLERGAPRRDVLPLLAPLVPRLDAQSFGREPASEEDVDRLAALCDRLLGGGIA